MQILKIIYFVARTWFDFNVLLPTWLLLIKADELLTGTNAHVVPYDSIEIDEQAP